MRVQEAIDSILEIADKNPQEVTAFNNNLLYKHFITIIEGLRKESIDSLISVQNIETTNLLRGNIQSYQNLMEVLASIRVK